MSAAKVGAAPWSKDYEWDLSSGWAYKKPRDWHRGVKRHQRTLHGADGQTYKMYYYPGTDYHLGFYPKDDQNRLAEAENAFSEDNATHGEVIRQKGCGHIAEVDYAQREKILRVEFVNDGSICLFFEVPTSIAGELIYLAKKGAKRSDGRHLLGIRFWDYIRIRGQRHGAKYPFEYEQHSSGYLTREKGRHAVKISLKDMRAIFGENYEGLKKLYNTHNISPDTTKFTVVLNDNELAKYAEEMEALHAENTEGQGHYGVKFAAKATVDENGNMDYSSATGNDLGYADWGSTPNIDRTNTVLGKIANKFESIGDQYSKVLNDELDKNIAMNASEKFTTDQKARRDMIKEIRELDADDNGIIDNLETKLRFYDLRSGKGRNVQNLRNLKGIAKDIGLGGQVDSWMKASGVEKVNQNRKFTGRVWTKQELIDFANDKVPGNIEPGHDAVVYKALIRAKDWQGALQYLKGHGSIVTYANRRGKRDEDGNSVRVEKQVYKRYAGAYDSVDEGD
jgi:hypothetical protein